MSQQPRRSLLLDTRRWPFLGGRSNDGLSSLTVQNDIERQGVANDNSRTTGANASGTGNSASGGGSAGMGAGGGGGGGGGGGTGNTGSGSPASTGGSSGPSATATADNTALVAAWNDRLQVLTVITAFLAGIDGELFSLTAYSSTAAYDTTDTVTSGTQQFVYCMIVGALILHVWATILGYFASFALTNYSFTEEQVTIHFHQHSAANSSTNADKSSGAVVPPPNDEEGGKASMESDLVKADQIPTATSTQVQPMQYQRVLVMEAVPLRQRLFSRASVNSSASTAGSTSPSGATTTPAPAKTAPQKQAPILPIPVHMLERCFYTCMAQTALGFIFALAGIVSYAWNELAVPVGAFGVACLGVGLLTSLWAIW